MTDREKLTELFDRANAKCARTKCPECKYDGDECWDKFLIDYLLENGVTFQTWIPVSERLPEDDLPKGSKRKSIKVLVTYKTSNGVPVVRTQVREKEPWFNSKGWDWTKSEPITHWMPLPEPPMEEH